MTSVDNPSAAQKIWGLLLTPANRRNALVLLGLMFVGMLLETLGIGLVIPALALLTQPDIANSFPVLQPALHAMGNPNQPALVVGGMLVLVGVYFIKTLFLALLAWRQSRFAFAVQAHLSQQLFIAYLRQPYTFHLQRNSAQLIRNVIGEVNRFTFDGILPAMLLLSETLVLAGLCFLLLLVEPVGTLAVTMVLGFASWVFYRLSRKHLAQWGLARQHHEGLRIQHLQQGLGGVKDVKLLGREADFQERYEIHNLHSARVGELQATLQQIPRLVMELLAVIGLAILVISMVAQGRLLDAVLPTLGVFAAAAFRFIPSVNRVLSAMQSLRYCAPVIDILHSELKLALPANEAANSLTPFNSVLELNQISYAYPGAEKSALTNISLTIQQGESVGFIGTSGAGKSTLVDILLGLLTPDTGQVSVDGKNIQENLRNWQDQIGYVPQSIFLTDDTLRRNVAFGLPNEQIDDAAVLRAIKAAQLEEFITGLPEGIDALVGERGIRLSGGQRQRIGIARALYHDPAVLVLDEATSALDTATEQEVMRAVTALQGSKTILIVAHRLSTVAHCNRIYKLEHGSLMDEVPVGEMIPVKKLVSSV